MSEIEMLIQQRVKCCLSCKDYHRPFCGQGLLVETGWVIPQCGKFEARGST